MHSPATISRVLTTPEFISNSMSDLLSGHHALGPFAAPPYLNFHSSTLGSVMHPHKPLKCRLINYLSWLHGSSMNDGIPDSEGHICYKAFDQAIAAIASSGHGTLLVKLDLKEAFHHIPMHPADCSLASLGRDPFTMPSSSFLASSLLPTSLTCLLKH